MTRLGVRFGRHGMAAVVEPKHDIEMCDDVLDGLYETFGIRCAAWIREVDEFDRRIVVVPPP